MSTSRWTEQDLQNYRKRMQKASVAKDGPTPIPQPQEQEQAQKRKRKAVEMNKTEARYAAKLAVDTIMEKRAKIKFQPLRLYLTNGHSYRPDFMVARQSGRIEFHETKGPYIHSRDSRILFDTARVDYPWFTFVWSQWKDGKWHSEEYPATLPKPIPDDYRGGEW